MGRNWCSAFLHGRISTSGRDGIGENREHCGMADVLDRATAHCLHMD